MGHICPFDLYANMYYTRVSWFDEMLVLTVRRQNLQADFCFCWIEPYINIILLSRSKEAIKIKIFFINRLAPFFKFFFRNHLEPIWLVKNTFFYLDLFQIVIIKISINLWLFFDIFFLFVIFKLELCSLL